MKSKHLEILSPAKVNLTLEIRGKFDDGYHYIETLIAPLELADKILIKEIGPGSSIEFTCKFSDELKAHLGETQNDQQKKIASENNLALRAAKIFYDEFKPKSSVKIELMKNIPFEAGLGGGSSNAAAVMVGLISLFEVKTEIKDVIKLSQKLGSDVPALLFNKLVFASRKGEGIRFLDTKAGGLESLACVLIKPTFSSSTPEAYKALSEVLSPPKLNSENDLEPSNRTRGLLECLELELLGPEALDNPYNYLTFFAHKCSNRSLKSGQLKQFFDCLHNDFEQVSRHPEYAEIRETLENLGVSKILLAGSGSSLVAFMTSIEEANQMAVLIKERLHENTFVTPSRVNLNT